MLLFYNRLKNLLTKTQKIYLILLILFSFFLGAVEMISLSSLVGFLVLVSDQSTAIQKIPLESLRLYLLSLTLKNLVVYSSIFLVLLFLFKNLILILFYYFQEKIVKNIYINLARNAFNTYLLLPYSFHLNQNAAITINSINTETKRVTEFLINLSIILKESITVIFLFLLMFVTNFKIAAFIFFLLLFVSLIFYKSISEKVKKIGIKVKINSEKVLQQLTEAISSIKILKLLNKNEFFVQNVFNEMARKQNNEIIFRLIGKLPRLILEVLAVIIVTSILLYFLFTNTDIKDSIPILSMITLIILRTLPAYTNININLSALRFNIKSVENISNLKNKYNEILSDHTKNKPLLSLKAKKISLKNLSFYFQSNQKILDNVNLELFSGNIYGIKGISGSGKTTLIDLILGLLSPSSGDIYVNDKKFDLDKFSIDSYASYVPQDIYLSDSSLAENIAIGESIKNINFKRIEEILKIANLNDLIKKLPKGYRSNIGEKGVKLSGGQRQRIGIARALYEDKSLIVFDEATSSLDYETERVIINEISKLRDNRIIILVAHRLKTLEICDEIIDLSDGKVNRNIN